MRGKIFSGVVILLILVGSYGAVGSEVNSTNESDDLENEIIDYTIQSLLGSIDGSRKALLVGISDYPPAGPGGPDLNYCDDDAYDMRDVLINGGWSSSDITVYIDSQGEESNIKSKLTSIASGTTSTSISLFFFSGHGTQDGSGEAICCYNSDMYDYELNDVLDNFNGRVVVIIDSCHSGGMSPDEYCIDIETFTDNFIETVGAGNENRVILMACAANEYSYEDPGLQNGVFTYFVVEGLEGPADENNDDIITAEETFNYAEPKTISYKPQQHPKLYDGDTSKEVPIIGGGGGDYIEETCYGQEYSSKDGDVKNFDASGEPGGSKYAVRLSEGGEDATVWYEFDIWSDKVVEIGIQFCDWGWFGDGPDLYAKNYNTGSWDCLGQNMGNQDDLTWKWKATSNPSNYVSSTGKVEIKVYAEKDAFLRGDDVILDEVGIKYEEKPRIPDLESEGSLNFGSAQTGSIVTGSFYVKNDGDPGSELDWEIDSHPDWGTWVFSPSSGNNLKPEDGDVKVSVTVRVPNEQGYYTGDVKVINTENSGDYEIIKTSLDAPRTKQLINPFIVKFFERFPILKEIFYSFLFLK